MNYLGHLLVALDEGTDPAFHAGTVLPDLLPLAGLTKPLALPPRVQAGWSHHLRVDSVFHHLAPFQQATDELTAELRHGGVRPGPRRAAGHVAVELLWDATWARLPTLRHHFGLALAWLTGPEGRGLPWSTHDAIDLLAPVLERLASAPLHERDAARITWRTARSLARRPALCPDAAELHCLEVALEARGDGWATLAAPALEATRRAVRTTGKGASCASS